MSLKDRIHADMQSALRAADKIRLGVLRFALAAIKQREVDTRRPLDDAGVVAVLERLVKQGREALGQFRAGGREDLAGKEEAEIAVLSSYLPEPLGDSELEALIAETIRETGATSLKDFGKVMSAIKAQATGRVDMSEVNTRVRAALEPEA